MVRDAFTPLVTSKRLTFIWLSEKVNRKSEPVVCEVAALNEAKESIIKQGKIAQFLKKTNIFPSTAIYLINSGEQSGNLGPMLKTVAEYYEIELEGLGVRFKEEVKKRYKNY